MGVYMDRINAERRHLSDAQRTAANNARTKARNAERKRNNIEKQNNINEAWNKLSPKEKLEQLSWRPGECKKQKAKILAQMANPNSHKVKPEEVVQPMTAEEKAIKKAEKKADKKAKKTEKSR